VKQPRNDQTKMC